MDVDPPKPLRLEAGCGDRERLTAELEFVQLLANPQYLQCEHPPTVHPRPYDILKTKLTLNPSPPSDLAQNNYFADPAFVSYLEYLLYWKRPEYAKLLM